MSKRKPAKSTGKKSKVSLRPNPKPTPGSFSAAAKFESPTQPSHLFNTSSISKKLIGISLSGGKSDKSCVCVIEYFAEHKKMFLTHLVDRIKSEEFISADLKIHEIILQNSEGLESVAFDCPLSLPKCMRCDLVCPGYELCPVDEIKWMRERYNEFIEKRKPKKLFTPYTQRSLDMYLSHLEDENLDVQHALGANLAPLTTRAIFIKRRLSVPCLEVVPKLSVWRLGQKWKVNKSQLRSYRNSVGGSEARRIILNAMVEKTGIFFYQQDLRTLVDNPHAFDALIAAYTAFLAFQNQVEPRPAGLSEWAAIPLSK